MRKYFSTENDLVYCNDVSGLMNDLGVVYRPAEWRLFIDSSKRSLKAVLLNNGNKLASIPIGHSTVLVESYEHMKLLLEKLQYSMHKWQICTDLKVVTIILGQQSGFTKFSCFLCEWDSRARDEHYVRKEWPARKSFIIGEKNIINKSLVDPADILLPPLHIQLGLFKQLVKALSVRESPAFDYLYEKFPKLSEAKIQAGVFTGPQIRQLLRDSQFTAKMPEDEKKAWLSFKEIKQNFLGHVKDPNYKVIVSNLVRNYGEIGCLMSFKLHLINSHVDCFPDNVGDYSEEQGERFHQDIKTMETRYQGFENADEHMLADYCWSLKRDTPNEHKRKALRRSFKETCRPNKKRRTTPAKIT